MQMLSETSSFSWVWFLLLGIEHPSFLSESLDVILTFRPGSFIFSIPGSYLGTLGVARCHSG